MPILDYNDGIVPVEVSIVPIDDFTDFQPFEKAKGGGHDFLYKANLNEEPVAIKARRDEFLSGFLRNEAYSLHQLRSVTCTPDLKGVLEHCKIPNTTDRINFGIVTSWARGIPILDCEIYWDEEKAAKYKQRTGTNIHAQFADQIGQYLRQSMQRGLVDPDLKKGDTFLDTTEERLLVTKIDQDNINNINDLNYLEHFSTENIPHKYSSAVHGLIAYIHNLPFSTPEYINNYLNRLKAKQLLDLTRRFETGDFKPKNDKINQWQGNPDPTQFLKFLNLWVPAMHEFGERFIS